MGFMAYWWMQNPPAAQKQRAANSGNGLALTANESDKAYGEGANIWIKKYNEETTNLASRFKADNYKPRQDGWVVVKNPRAQFFMNDGRAIFIEGDNGEVIMDENKTGMKALAGSRDTPSRGRLYNVKIRLFNNITDPEAQLDEAVVDGPNPEKPSIPGMTITLNNASFDNQTFKIYSEAYGKGKGHVAADMVPVKLRGDDYNFDGKGLVIRWNERDRRLQQLEVAHGEKLEIIHPNQFMKKEQPAVAMGDPFDGLMTGPFGGLMDGPLPMMLVAKNKGAAAEALTPPAAAPSARRVRPNLPKPKITPSTEPPLYRAIFHDNVKIVQGDDLSAFASKMSVDFLMQDQENAEKPPAAAPAPKTGKSGKSATTIPTTGTSTATTRPVEKAKVATTKPTKGATKLAIAQTRTPATTRAVDPNEHPVIITWTGKLVVEPLSVGTENPIKNGDAVVRLDGAPVVAVQQGSTIKSGSLTYRTEDQAMLLTPINASTPVTMTDTKGAVVETTRLDFFQPKHQAILYGASNATFPQEDDAGKPGAPLLAKWTKTCTLYFASTDNAANGSMNIERAELEGNVDVTHPQIKIKSDQLELSFDTKKGAATRPATMPVIGEAVAVVPADVRLQSLKNSIDEMDARIAHTATPFGAGNPDAVVQAKSKELETLETTLATQNKAIRERTETGQSTPQAQLDQMEQTRKQFATAKVDFDLLQMAAVKLQDFKGERARLVKQSADVQKEISSAKATTRATTQATTRPAVRTDLRQLVATGIVHCEMTDSAKKTQTIDCNRLTLQTAATGDGKIYPKTVNADGEVHVIDPDQDLRAGHLAVVLRPATQPSKSAGGGDTASAELQSLIAHDHVRVESKDGTITTSDQLLVDNKDGKNNVKLLGEPFAHIVDKKNTLSGPIIEIFPDAQQLQVVGAGNMKGIQQEKPGDPEKPIDVTWIRGMTFNGKTNVVDVTGQVVAVTKDADGATNTARGDRVKMLLADAVPTTRPAATQATTQAAIPVVQPTTQLAIATTQATSRPTTRPSRGGDYGGMASKTVRHITFDDNATIESITLADDGSLLRRTHLEAQTVNYDLLRKEMVIPVEGRMIVEDHRPTTQPVAAAQGEPRPAGAKVDGNGENNRGTTAFHWPIKFTYDDSVHQAVMTGEANHQVVVVHRDDSPKAQSFRLTGDVVTADLEEVATTQPASKPVAVATTQATTKPADRLSKVQLKRVTATGNLLFTGPGAEIHALFMEYDPHTHWLIARGTEQELVDFTVANQPLGSKKAEEVHYNLDTGEVQATKLSLQMRR